MFSVSQHVAGDALLYYTRFPDGMHLRLVDYLQHFVHVQVEAAMVESMQEVCRKGLNAYAATPRSSWVLEWPSQVLLAVSSINWTQEVAQAIQGRPEAGRDSTAAGQGGKGALAAVAAKCTSQLNELVELVRGDLSVLNRCGPLCLCTLS